jgi:hypothetical protein
MLREAEAQRIAAEKAAADAAALQQKIEEENYAAIEKARLAKIEAAKNKYTQPIVPSFPDEQPIVSAQPIVASPNLPVGQPSTLTDNSILVKEDTKTKTLNKKTIFIGLGILVLGVVGYKLLKK